jgi:Cytochrome c-type biogenesis protein CcmF C-terminal
VYINLMAFTSDGKNATIKVILEPFVPWIWFGGLIMALGSVLSAWPVAKRSARSVGYTVPQRAPVAAGGAYPAMPMTQASSMPITSQTNAPPPGRL